MDTSTQLNDASVNGKAGHARGSHGAKLRPEVRQRHKTVKFNKLLDHEPQSVRSWSDIESALSRLVSTPVGNVSLYVVRHGHTSYNRTNRISGKHNTRLTNVGRQQAHLLAEKFDVDIDYIFSSDLDRAVDTAGIFRESRHIKHTIITDSRLQEVDLGIKQGTRRQHWPDFAAGNIDFAPPDGESYRQAARRVASFLVDLGEYLNTKQENQAAVAIFSHSGIMRVIHSFVSECHTPADVFNADFRNTELLEAPFRKINIPGFWIQD